MLLRSRRVENFQLNRHLRGQKKKKRKEVYFQLEFEAQSRNRFRRSAEHMRTCSTRSLAFQLRTKSIRATILHPPPSIVKHRSAFRSAQSVQLRIRRGILRTQPIPRSSINDSYDRRRASPFNTYRQRYMDTRILRHGTRFKPSSTRLPPSPARFERVRFVGAQKQGEETNGIERFLHIARLDGLPRAKPSFERHSSSLEEREWRKGEGSSLRAGISAGTGRSRGKESKSWSEFSTRFCSATATSRCGL